MAAQHGRINDRGFYLEHNAKSIRFTNGGAVEPQGSVVIFEDFLGDAINGDTTIITQSGTPTTAAAISATAGDPVAGHGGWIAGATDDVDAEIDEIAVGAPTSSAGALRADRAGDGMLVCEWGFTIPDALTARQYFVGLTDDPTEGTGTNGPINIQTGTTIVSPASDAVGFIFSSLATAPTVWKLGSVDSDTDSTLITGVLTATADTKHRLRVEVDVDGNCYAYHSLSATGDFTFSGTPDQGISKDVLLVPIFTAAATTTTAVPWEIDYCYASCAR